MATKICKNCNKEKPLSDFLKDPAYKDGYRYTCKECRINKGKDLKTKICIKCNKEKDVSEFHKHHAYKDGYQHICKECRYKEIAAIKTKICKRCKKEKDVSEFNKDPSMKDGYRATCKECLSYKGNEDIKTKICTKCNKEKLLSEFHKEKYSKDGHRAECKECRSTRKTRLVTITIDGKEYQAKQCTVCNQIKPLEMFYRSKMGLGGRDSWCIQCHKDYNMRNQERIKEQRRRYYLENKERVLAQKRAWKETHPEYYKEYYRKWYEKNKERVKKNSRRWYLANKERHREQMAKWYTENWDRFQHMKRVVFHRRRTMQTSLPNTLTHEEIDDILKYFGNACSLTGRTDDIHLDHFIPLAIGHGGTYKGNIIPLTREVNRSKSAKNPFEWIEDEETKKMVDMDRWEKLIKYLADQNGLTVDEFKDYVNWCFENPRTVEEIEEGVTSIELWRRSRERVEDLVGAR